MGNGQTGPGQGPPVNSVTVVLAGNLQFSAKNISDRMISSPMAEFQLVSLRSVRQSQELMSQADAEHGYLAPQRLQRFDYLGKIPWVSRSIGNQYSIRMQGQDLFVFGIKGDDGDITPVLIQHSYDIGLHPAVYGHHIV